MKNSPIGIKSIFMVVLVLTFLIPMDVFAKSPFYITAKPGIYSPQSSDLDETGFNGEIAFGWRFNPYIATEFGIGYFNTEVEKTFVGATYVDREEFNIKRALCKYVNWDEKSKHQDNHKNNLYSNRGAFHRHFVLL